jgi:hypothetical protein
MRHTEDAMHCIPGSIPGTRFDPHVAEFALEIAALDPLAAELALEVAAGRIHPAAAPHPSASTPFALMQLLALVLGTAIALVSLVLWLA